MTSQCLLAAEADQIQDFVFRAARLREVVGGSQLLARFCDGGVRALLTHPRYGGDPATDIVISDGGAFRIIFKGEDVEAAKAKAEAFGRDLSELYRRAAGGSLTVAPPVTFSYKDDFHRANDEAQKLLRWAKRKGDKPAATAHLPYVAFCASCGLAPAAAHRKKVAAEDARANYLCPDCARKDAEQQQQRRSERRPQPEGFIEEFRRAVRRQLERMMSPDEAEGIRLGSPEKGDWSEVIGSRKLDPRRYVAYMVADGNDMGRLFDGCDEPDQMKGLSEALTDALRESLAGPCATLIAQQEKVRGLGLLPVLPLILGGDDLFALLPAPWAIDFAARFCREYEQRLGAALREINLFKEQLHPTIAAAVVICKATYPHTLAHERANDALKEAKQVARRLEIEGSENPVAGRSYRASVLNFTIITGSQINADGSAEKFYRARLRPYFVGDDSPEEWGVNIERLLDARFALNALPGKRRSELERLYEIPPAGNEEQANDDLEQRWLPDLKRLLERIGTKESKLRIRLEEVLAHLGADAPKQGCWNWTRRTSTRHWRATGVMDLLEAWDFAFCADRQASEYEGE